MAGSSSLDRTAVREWNTIFLQESAKANKDEEQKRCYEQAIVQIIRVDTEIQQELKKTKVVSSSWKNEGNDTNNNRNSKFPLPFQFFAFYQQLNHKISWKEIHRHCSRLRDDEYSTIISTVQILKRQRIGIIQTKGREGDKESEQSLDIALLLARNYVKLNLWDDARSCFRIACKEVPVQKRDWWDMGNKTKRNVERLSQKHREIYHRQSCTQAEQEYNERVDKQCIRRMAGHFALFGNSLQRWESEKATEHIKTWLSLSRQRIELIQWHERNLRLLINILSLMDDINDMGENGLWRDKFYHRDESILLSVSLGSLRDLYIDALTEYMSIKKNDDPVAIKKLARLHALRRELSLSRDMYIQGLSGEILAKD